MKEIQNALDVEELFDILSNSTRRKILQLLSTEELYPFQISKILDISPRIVGKYITELEELGLVSTIERKSDKGPSRKYAQLTRAFSIMVDVSPNNFSWKVVPIEAVEESLYTPKKTKSLISEETAEKIDKVKNSIREKINQIKEIDNKRKELIHDINECFRFFNQLLDEKIEEYSDRVYVRALIREMFNSQVEWISLTKISNVLREYRIEIRDRLVKLAEKTGLVKYKVEDNEYWFSI